MWFQLQQQQNHLLNIGSRSIFQHKSFRTIPTFYSQLPNLIDQEIHKQNLNCNLNPNLVAYHKFQNLQLSYTPIQFEKVITSFQDRTLLYNGNYQYEYPEGYRVLLVEKLRNVQPAVNILKESLQDNLIAVDFEWTPDGLFPNDIGSHNISMIQVATQNLCILFRVCKWQFKMPKELYQLICDPNIVTLYHGSEDQEKLRATFDLNINDFNNSLDFQWLLRSMGYAKVGVYASCLQMWGVSKPKKGSLTNWEKARLTDKNVHYAALDVFILGTIIRRLKHLQSQNKGCDECQQCFGKLIQYGQEEREKCSSCSRWKLIDQNIEKYEQDGNSDQDDVVLTA